VETTGTGNRSTQAAGVSRTRTVARVGRSVRLLALGDRSYDVEHRALVMGILNRTPDSFYDRGATFALDALLRRAEQLVEDGADLLDVGGVKAGPGPEVSETEELERVVPAIEAITTRFDVPVSVDTWRASVAKASFEAGAVVGNDISGFADPEYLEVAARVGASVVATHIRLAPRVPDPDPFYVDVVATVAGSLARLADRAMAAGLPAERVVLDAGLDLGKSAAQSLELLRASDVLAGLGHPLLLSASNKTFLGTLLGLEIAERRVASLSAAAFGVTLGCRILRVHDVAGAVRVRDALAEVLSARGGEPVPARRAR
jgi:dihydropteroate synthase